MLRRLIRCVQIFLKQGSRSRQKVMRLYKRWHRPITKRFIKPPLLHIEMKVSLTWVEMDRYVYSSVQKESSAAVLVQVHYINSHKLPLCKTAPPVERPRDTTAICLLLCKGRQLIFGLLPVSCRMVIAAPGSFAFLGCTTASGETCSYWSQT